MPPDAMTDDPIERAYRGARGFARGVFAVWRGWLTTARDDGVAAEEAGRTERRMWWAQWPTIRRYLTDPLGAWMSRDAAAVATAAAFGPRAAAAGVAFTCAVVLGTGGTLRGVAATALVEALWALGRYAILRIVVQPRPRYRRRLTAAYLAGLIPMALGVTDGLRLIALAGSAVLTMRGLRGAGFRPRATRTAIGWAFGGHAATIALGWLTGVVALLAAGS